MKHVTFIFFMLFLTAFTLSAQVGKRCKLDERPFSERVADYQRVLQYPSGFEDYNGKYWPEDMWYKDQWFAINYSPLCDFKNITESLLGDVMPISKAIKSDKCPTYLKTAVTSAYHLHNSSRRGFIGTWIIWDNKLYLKEIESKTADTELIHTSIKDFMEKPIRLKSVNLSPEKLHHRVEKATGRSFDADTLLFADWFTGTLLGETYHSNNEVLSTLFIYIQNGVVKAAKVRDCKPLAADYHEPVYFFERTDRAFDDSNLLKQWYNVEKGTPNTEIKLPIVIK